MGAEQILEPRWRVTCDACGATIETGPTPFVPGWSSANVDAGLRLLVCPDCSTAGVVLRRVDTPEQGEGRYRWELAGALGIASDVRLTTPAVDS